MKFSKLCFLNIFTLLLFLNTGFAQVKNKGDFLTRAVDKKIKPGTDFFKYATGTWMKENPIPPAERAWGIGNLVQEETYQRLKGILENAEDTKSPQGSNEQKIGDFYFTGMDSSGIEKMGIKPIEPELKMIDSIKDKTDLWNTVAYLQREGVGVMFDMYVDQDQKNSNEYALYLWQGG